MTNDRRDPSSVPPSFAPRSQPQRPTSDDVNVVGLTLSENQKRHIEEHWFANSKSDRKMEVRLQPWEDFDGRVDRIVSIGAFEHFGFNKYMRP